MNTDVRENLIKARNLLTRRSGWGQGNFKMLVRVGSEKTGFTFQEQFCAIGAIREADGPGEIDAYAALEKALGVNHAVQIVQWNDNPKRLKKEVIAAFDQAIELVS